jgi:hypothetical protein
MSGAARVCLTVAMAGSFAIWFGARAQSLAPAKDAGSTKAGPMVTGFAPLNYFQNQCANCHGDYGAAYGSEFGKNITEKQMNDFVRDMAAGPGQMPLNDADLAVETGFHRALQTSQPFGVAVAWEGGVLSGEALPGSTVSLEIDGKTEAVPLAGNAWKIAVPSGADWSKIQLRVQKDKKETVVPLATRAF